MSVARSPALFALAAIAEIGGAWLVWQGVREHRGLAYVGAGIVALAGYGFVATLPTRHPLRSHPRCLRRHLFVAGSLAWGMALDGFKPERYDIAGATICLLDIATITYAPR